MSQEIVPDWERGVEENVTGENCPDTVHRSDGLSRTIEVTLAGRGVKVKHLGEILRFFRRYKLTILQYGKLIQLPLSVE